MRFVHMLKAHQDLSFRIGTHHCNYLQTHEYIKKRKVEGILCCCHQTTIYYDTTLNVKKSSPASTFVTKWSMLAHTYPKMFDWERTYFLCSLEFHQKIRRVFILRVWICLFVSTHVWVCVCPTVIHDVPKRPSYSLVNEEKLLFSLGLIILFKHPVVSSGSCTSTNSLHMLMLTTTASNLQ